MFLKDQGNGFSILFVHGQPGQSSNWDPIVKALGPNYRCLLPDRPGYGLSGENPTGMRNNAIALVKLLEERKIQELVVVGHSLGGGIALEMARIAPALVKGLVLLAPVGLYSCLTTLDFMLGVPLVGEILALSGLITLDILLPFALSYLENSNLPFREKLLFELRHTPKGSVSPRPILRSLRTFMIEQDYLLFELPILEKTLKEVEVPTVILSGSEDNVIPPSSTKELQNILINSNLTWIEGAGHLLTIEAPDQVAKHIKNIVKEVL